MILPYIVRLADGSLRADMISDASPSNSTSVRPRFFASLTASRAARASIVVGAEGLANLLDRAASGFPELSLTITPIPAEFDSEKKAPSKLIFL